MTGARQGALLLEQEAEQKPSWNPEAQLAPPADGNGWQSRNYHGYHQAREWVDGEPGDWTFHIPYFYGDDDPNCPVLMWDGTKSDVPITKNAAILIRGRYYGRRWWTH